MLLLQSVKTKQTQRLQRVWKGKGKLVVKNKNHNFVKLYYYSHHKTVFSNIVLIMNHLVLIAISDFVFFKFHRTQSFIKS